MAINLFAKEIEGVKATTTTETPLRFLTEDNVKTINDKR